MTRLDRTLPVRPFHLDGFFGTVQVDVQHPRVAALVCHQFDIVALSLVGYDTSVSGTLATLWQCEQLAFLLADSAEWHSPLRLQRLSIGYKQFSTRIRQELGYREPIPLDQALRRTIAWERAHPPADHKSIIGAALQ